MTEPHTTKSFEKFLRHWNPPSKTIAIFLSSDFFTLKMQVPTYRSSSHPVRSALKEECPDWMNFVQWVSWTLETWRGGTDLDPVHNQCSPCPRDWPRISRCRTGFWETGPGPVWTIRPPGQTQRGDCSWLSDHFQGMCHLALSFLLWRLRSYLWNEQKIKLSLILNFIQLDLISIKFSSVKITFQQNDNGKRPIFSYSYY